MKRPTIRTLNSIASGECLSKRYVNSQIPLHWQCALGHRWKALAGYVKNRGTWCPDCAGIKRLTLREMQLLATHRGGECLSKRYVNEHTKLKWRCIKGHSWQGTPLGAKRGHWCPSCAHTSKLSLEELQAEANRRGGRCLSTQYINVEAHLRWECAVGHEWDARPAAIRKGSWCPYCAHVRKLRLGEMQKIAQERGGKCISENYRNCYTNLVWECAVGHRWKATPANVKGGSRRKGSWCRKCYVMRAAFHPLGDLEKMRDIARTRGGRCLSSEYVNANTAMEWECDREHRWRAVPRTVSTGSWCPICARNRRLTLAEFQVLAHRRGGRCLSPEYRNRETKLHWQCADGHQWYANAGQVRKGSWCNRCAIERRKSTWKKSATNVLPLRIAVIVTLIRLSKVFFARSQERNALCAQAYLKLKRLLQSTNVDGGKIKPSKGKH